jgi:hypothetical protein
MKFEKDTGGIERYAPSTYTKNMRWWVDKMRGRSG